MFASLEELMTYIGSSYPHYRLTVLPITIVCSILYFTSRFLTGIEKIKVLKNIENEEQTSAFYYSKCRMNLLDDSIKVARVADFMPCSVPKWQYTIVMNTFILFCTTTTFNDSLYSLLARSKTDQMQDRLANIFKKAEISLAPDAVIDQIAFEHFEDNDSPIEILKRTLCTSKCIQEVFICGVISGVCVTLNGYTESELNMHGELKFFDKMLLPNLAYTVSGISLIGFSIWMPKHRILPVIILIPILFLSILLIVWVPHWANNFDRCLQQPILRANVVPFYFSIGIFTSSLTDMIRFFVRIHLIEVIPVMIRAPVIAVLYYIEYSFDGHIRELYSTEGIGPAMAQMLASTLQMMILLIAPRKINDMNVYFFEYTRDDRKKSIPPAPEFVKEKGAHPHIKQQ
uniref:Uncharacterized protein n=1 Tax=Caenorhabditis japonica TaxID=281687 RepID=A0A8R1I9M9_CAEJA